MATTLETLRNRIPSFVLVAWMGALGCNTTIGGGGDGADAGEDNGGGEGDRSCTTAEECPGEQVCDPRSSLCSSSVPCAVHDNCGAAAHCNGDGVCVKSATGSPCDQSMNCSFAEACIGGFCGCDGVTFQAEPVPANMMIVLDRSGSMLCHVNGSNNVVGANNVNSRWQHAKTAISGLLAAYDDAVRFGLAVYPNPDKSKPASSGHCVGTPPCSDCNPGKTLVHVQERAGSAIQTALSSSSVNPGGCTPSGPALQAQVGYAPLMDPNADNYVLYITDGAEACSSLRQVTAINNLRNQDVKTFVVGFTEQVNPSELNAAAEAGGTARPGPIKYYQANDGASLAAALAEIGGLAMSCAYSLDGTPEDLDDLHVYADGLSIVRDPSQVSGWDYDPDSNQIRFYGPICDAMRAGGVEDLVVVHGCPVTID